MEFIAEIKRTSQIKRVSNDNDYEILFVTNNPQILDLGKLPSNQMVKVDVTLHSTKASDEDKEDAGYEGI